MTTYRELVSRAREAGIDFIGLSKPQLEKLLSGEDITVTRKLEDYFISKNKVEVPLSWIAKEFEVSLDGITTPKKLYQKIMDTHGEIAQIVIKSPLKKRD